MTGLRPGTTMARIAALEAAVTDLRTQLAALEQKPPARDQASTTAARIDPAPPRPVRVRQHIGFAPPQATTEGDPS